VAVNEPVYRMGGEHVPASEMKKWHHARGIPWGTPFDGPDPVTICRMARPDNMNVHLANEHGASANAADPLHGVHLAHLLAHAYGQFRDGQGHYHETPEQEGA